MTRDRVAAAHGTDEPCQVVFFGTPEFAVPSLRALHESGYAVTLVVTQPDRPAGRGRTLTPPPVKAAASALGLPVFQPNSLKTPEALERLAAATPDLIVVVAYGKILPRAVLDLPRAGCVNVHASLLPRYRGAAPIQWAILNGDQETGISIMLMTEELDAGPVLLARRVPIGPEETYGELEARLALVGAECLIEALAGWRAGALHPQPQDPAQVSFAPMIRKEHGRIWWTAPAQQICRQVRAFQPWPGAYFFWRGRLIKVQRARALDGTGSGQIPGTVLAADDRLIVQTGEGAVELLELQPEGRRRMTAKEFLAGHKLHPGEVFE